MFKPTAEKMKRDICYAVAEKLANFNDQIQNCNAISERLERSLLAEVFTKENVTVT